MIARSIAAFAALLLAFTVPVRAADAKHTSLTWYGQSAFRLVTPLGHVLYLDPWLENPKNPAGAAEVAAIKRADLILVTHGHFDHVGETAQIAKQTQAKVVASLELGDALVQYAGVPKSSVGMDSLGNVGGTMSFFDGEVRVTIVHAVHSSSINEKALGVSSDESDHAAGEATGFIIAVRKGPVIYDTGDTALFGDMARFANRHVDVMLTCIGDHFTMGPKDAATAVTLVRPRIAVPMHYGTLPILTGTPAEFTRDLHAAGSPALEKTLRIGETISI